MHYRNGRQADNGDRIVKLDDKGNVVAFGVLHSAVPGDVLLLSLSPIVEYQSNDYCNGSIAVIQPANDYACLVDCLHVEDVAAALRERGLDKRPHGK